MRCPTACTRRAAATPPQVLPALNPVSRDALSQSREGLLPRPPGTKRYLAVLRGQRWEAGGGEVTKAGFGSSQGKGGGRVLRTGSESGAQGPLTSVHGAGGGYTDVPLQGTRVLRNSVGCQIPNLSRAQGLSSLHPRVPSFCPGSLSGFLWRSVLISVSFFLPVLICLSPCLSLSLCQSLLTHCLFLRVSVSLSLCFYAPPS